MAVNQSLVASVRLRRILSSPCNTYRINLLQISQISQGPNIYKDTKPKCRLFLKIDQLRYLAAGVYLSEAPSPS
jgi:hypothetical protein